MESFTLRERTITLLREGNKVDYILREITSDDYWSIQEECIDKKNLTFPLDTHKLNLMIVSKCVKNPPMSIEAVARLPKQIGDRLLDECRILNSVEETYFLEDPKPQSLEESQSSTPA